MKPLRLPTPWLTSLSLLLYSPMQVSLLCHSSLYPRPRSQHSPGFPNSLWCGCSAFFFISNPKAMTLSQPRS